MKRILIAAATDNSGNYTRAVRECGAESAVTLDFASASDFAALILPGGGDIEPSLFGQPNAGSRNIDAALDRAQFDALRAFADAGLPVLGICRGAQVINVCFGGDLVQDLPNAAEVHAQDELNRDRFHATRVVLGSALERCYGAKFDVNSAHHQAIGTLGSGLSAIQWANDGVIEAVVHSELPILGVQWHPERMQPKFGVKVLFEVLSYST